MATTEREIHGKRTPPYNKKSERKNQRPTKNHRKKSRGRGEGKRKKEGGEERAATTEREKCYEREKEDETDGSDKNEKEELWCVMENESRQSAQEMIKQGTHDEAERGRANVPPDTIGRQQ